MIGKSKLIATLAILAGGLCLAKAAYIPVKGVVANILIERAWSKSQAQNAPVLPWPWMDAQPLARLSVPRLGQSEVLLLSLIHI